MESRFLSAPPPFVCNMYNQYLNDKAILEYDSKVVEFDDEQTKSVLKEAEEYNKAHPNITIKDTFSGEKTPESKEYKNVLNPMGDGSMGYIEIPKIKVRLMVYHGTDESVLERSCGHIEGTSLPVGGKNTHCMLAAHRGLSTAKLFTDLDQMEENDIFFLSVLGHDYYYKVDRILTVKPDELSFIQSEPEEDRVTLITCTPYGVNSHRLLVSGCRTSYVEVEEDAWPLWIYIIVTLICAVLILIVLLRRRNRRKKEGDF